MRDDGVNGRRLWSVEWHTLFTDKRNALTWRNRFEKVGKNENVVQYFSSGEDVLRKATAGDPSDLDGMSGTNAWNIQEKGKGTVEPTAIGGGSSAGWGFNLCKPPGLLTIRESCSHLTHTEAETFFTASNEALIQAPFFDSFENTELMNPNPVAEGIVDKSYPYNLGYEIPALSFAAGGTESGIFLLKNKAIDMNNDMVDDEQAWPKERGGKVEVEKWHHSDFKDVAYRYTYKLFDNLVTEGKLNETK